MEINKIDKSNMRQVIVESPNQLKKGLELVFDWYLKDIKHGENFSNVVVCGIGGSVLAVEVLNAFTKTSIPVYIHRDYGLPSVASEKSLIICISYSGNTEETLSALQEATSKKFRITCISSGGKVEKLCTNNDIPLIIIPSGIQPRCAIGYMFSALAKILINEGIIQDCTAEILETSKKLAAINPALEKQGEKLAKKLVKKIPIVYSSNTFKAVAKIWKIKFNENSKIPAFYNYFPELNHNEMVGYTGLKKLGTKNFYVLILQDSTNHPRILKIMKLTADIIKKSGANVEVIPIQEGSLLFKIFSSLLLGDWVSYYVAIENDIDPTPVKMVEEFKELMQK